MSYYSIEGEDVTIKTFVLVSYEVALKEKTVIVKFSSTENSVTYELRPGMQFESVDAIYSSLQNKLTKAVASGFPGHLISRFPEVRFHRTRIFKQLNNLGKDALILLVSSLQNQFHKVKEIIITSVMKSIFPPTP